MRDMTQMGRNEERGGEDRAMKQRANNGPPSSPHARDDHDRRHNDPTPETIAARAARERAERQRMTEHFAAQREQWLADQRAAHARRKQRRA